MKKVLLCSPFLLTIGTIFGVMIWNAPSVFLVGSVLVGTLILFFIGLDSD